MPLLDIAISQPCSCFRNNILAFNSEARFHNNKLVVGNDNGLGCLSRFSWNTLYHRKKINLGRTQMWRHRMMINAVAILEITSLGKEDKAKVRQNDISENVRSVEPNASTSDPQSFSDDSTEVGEREKLRRMRISKANKGNTPWNLGKKHSPETLKLIRERTRLAMQDPKVKKKLINLGHAQSEETRVKIAVGVRLGWERRREKLMLQENCHYDWQNLIAVSARKGLLGEDELEWDSYDKMNNELDQEWLQSIEQRKNAPRPNRSKRAPKSAEQKKKIAAAIAAKWADPDYRNRVCSGLAKFHGTEGKQRKPQRKPSGGGSTRLSTSRKKKDENNIAVKWETKSESQVQRPKPKRRKMPSYKDPLANSKLEMLKSIRAQRATPSNKHAEVITRAKLLISEAKRAAEALAIPAMTSPRAQASLLESKKLIAEAVQVIESIEDEERVSSEDEDELLVLSIIEKPLHVKENGEETDEDGQNQEKDLPQKVNGVHNGNASLSYSSGFLWSEHEGKSEICNLSLNTVDRKPLSPNGSICVHETKLLVNGLEGRSEDEGEQKKLVNNGKKWVRGRLVEVAEV